MENNGIKRQTMAIKGNEWKRMEMNSHNVLGINRKPLTDQLFTNMYVIVFQKKGFVHRGEKQA